MDRPNNGKTINIIMICVGCLILAATVFVAATSISAQRNATSAAPLSSEETAPEKETETVPPTEAPTETAPARTEPATEARTEPATEPPTEPVTEATTEPPTEAPTQPAPTAPSASESEACEHVWEEVTETVHHDAVTHTEHHDAVTETVHHDAVYEERSVLVSEGYYLVEFAGAVFGGDAVVIPIKSYDYDAEAWRAAVEAHAAELIAAGQTGEYTLQTATAQEAWDAFSPERAAAGIAEGLITVLETAEPVYETQQVLIEEAWDEEVTVKEAWDEEIVDAEAFDETVVTGYRCSRCGETRPAN